jgi:hypothetical protein
LQISFRIAAVASLSSLALVAVSNTIAFAAPDPDNHGHHYGQLKHPKVTSPPPPVPTPTPHPVVQPTPNVAPVVHTPAGRIISAGPVLQPAPVSASPDPIVPVAPVIELNRATDSAGQYDWLLVLILPLLLAVWLIAFVGLARRLSGASKKALQVQTAPA